MDVIGAKLSGDRLPVFVEHAPELVPALVGLTTRQTGIVMTRWAAMADAVIDAPPPDPSGRRFSLSPSHDGWGEITGRLDPAGTQVVKAALAAAAGVEAEGEPRRTAAQRDADALVQIARFYLDHASGTPTTRGSRPDVHVVVTLEDLLPGTGCDLNGSMVDPMTVGAMLCDAGVHRFVTSGASVMLDAGRTTRTVSPQLFIALAIRDGGCRFPGCDQPVARCEAHHVVPWQHGGATDQSNLVLVCWRHHHDFAHHPEWHLKLLDDATVEVTRPDGVVLTSRPPSKPATAFHRRI
jgi:hypothetical protein